MRPRRVVAVVGTGTDVGKTWVAARLLEHIRAAGSTVSARKPAQSYSSDARPETSDAALLGMASGEDPASVCPRHRWFEAAMAPPMAAEALGRGPFTLRDLLDELDWPRVRVDVGLVETAGGVRSPLASDGDCLAFCEQLRPDLVLLVAEAGLGAINSVRLAVDSLRPTAEPVVVLNRYERRDELHQRNKGWLSGRDGLRVFESPGDEAVVCELVRS